MLLEFGSLVLLLSRRCFLTAQTARRCTRCAARAPPSCLLLLLLLLLFQVPTPRLCHADAPQALSFCPGPAGSETSSKMVPSDQLLRPMAIPSLCCIDRRCSAAYPRDPRKPLLAFHSPRYVGTRNPWSSSRTAVPPWFKQTSETQMLRHSDGGGRK